MVSKVDSQAEGTSSKGFGRVEGIHNCGFLAGLHGTVVGDSSEVLDVEVEVHGVAEGGINGIQDEVFVTIVCEAHKELNKFTSWQVCGNNEMRIMRIFKDAK